MLFSMHDSMYSLALPGMKKELAARLDRFKKQCMKPYLSTSTIQVISHFSFWSLNSWHMCDWIHVFCMDSISRAIIQVLPFLTQGLWRHGNQDKITQMLAFFVEALSRLHRAVEFTEPDIEATYQSIMAFYSLAKQVQPSSAQDIYSMLRAHLANPSITP